MIRALTDRMRPRVVSCRARPRRRELSLSFDDGPSDWTPLLLDALAESAAAAKRWPTRVDRWAEECHPMRRLEVGLFTAY